MSSRIKSLALWGTSPQQIAAAFGPAENLMGKDSKGTYILECVDSGCAGHAADHKRMFPGAKKRASEGQNMASPT